MDKNQLRNEYRKAQGEMFRVTKLCEANGIQVFDRAPELAEENVKNCCLVPNRVEIIKRISEFIPNPVCVEVGVDTGNFSRKLLDLLKPLKLHLIDRELERISPENRIVLDSDPRVEFLSGDSYECLSSFEDQYFDIIYIDANHSYIGVNRDIQISKYKIKDGGYLVFNDYTVWSPKACGSNGVARAVNEFCRREGYEFRYLCIQGLFYNDVAITKIYVNA